MAPMLCSHELGFDRKQKQRDIKGSEAKALKLSRARFKSVLTALSVAGTSLHTGERMSLIGRMPEPEGLGKSVKSSPTTYEENEAQ